MGQGPPGCKPCCTRSKIGPEELFPSPVPSKQDSKQAFEDTSGNGDQKVEDELILPLAALKLENLKRPSVEGKNGPEPDASPKENILEVLDNSPDIADAVASTNTFFVPLNKYEGTFGLEVDMDDGVGLIVNAVTDGQVQEWNIRHLEHMQVRPGDRILSVDHKRGDPNELLKLLTIASSTVDIEIKPHTEFAAALYKTPTEALGLSLRHREHGKTLFVRAVKNDGLVAKWNEENNGSEIVAGDRIVEVNGVRCSASHLDNLLREDGELKLVLVRFDEHSA